MPPPEDVRRAALIDQLRYLRDELALLVPLLPRLEGPLLEERPRPDVPSFAETLDALARADAERRAALTGLSSDEAVPLPEAATFAERLDRFQRGRDALADAFDAHDWAVPMPSGEAVEAYVRRAVLADADALRTIGAYLFEAQRK